MDLLHAFRPHALRILKRALVKPVFNGARSIRVVRPEDIIGLKVQAMFGNPLRKTLEAADIETLRRNSSPADPRNLNLDAYLTFLADFSRVFPQATRPRLLTGGRFLI